MSEENEKDQLREALRVLQEKQRHIAAVKRKRDKRGQPMQVDVEPWQIWMTDVPELFAAKLHEPRAPLFEWLHAGEDEEFSPRPAVITSGVAAHSAEIAWLCPSSSQDWQTNGRVEIQWTSHRGTSHRSWAVTPWMHVVSAEVGQADPSLMYVVLPLVGKGARKLTHDYRLRVIPALRQLLIDRSWLDPHSPRPGTVVQSLLPPYPRGLVVSSCIAFPDKPRSPSNIVMVVELTLDDEARDWEARFDDTTAEKNHLVIVRKGERVDVATLPIAVDVLLLRPLLSRWVNVVGKLDGALPRVMKLLDNLLAELE